MIQTTAPNGLTISAIAPRGSAKFSPNLYRWLTARSNVRAARHSRVFSDAGGVLWIGELWEGDCFIGSRLQAVLCNGPQESRCSYEGQTFISGMVEVHDFWSMYMVVGRCAIDTEHKIAFTGEDARWRVQGETRSCLWCGNANQTMRRWTETVERSAWTTPD